MSILDEYYKFENISEEREKELFENIKDEKNRNEIIKSHLKLVAKIAKKYSFLNPSMFEDLIQEGTLGLVLSIDRFNPLLGFRFSTFALFYIRNHIRQSLRKSAFIFHVPSKKLHQILKLVNEMKKSEQLTGSEMHITKICEVMDCSQDQAGDFVSILFDKKSYCESMASKAIDIEGLDKKLKLIEIKEILSYFSEKDRKIIDLRYNHSCSWRDIGIKIGISHEGCRKKHDKIIELIRSHLSSQTRRSNKSTKHDLCPV